MSSTGSGYDQSVFTYSPEGRIFQVEYAQKAVEAGGTAVGVRCRDGVILGVEKLVASKMLVEGSGEAAAHALATPTRAGAAPAASSPPLSLSVSSVSPSPFASPLFGARS